MNNPQSNDPFHPPPGSGETDRVRFFTTPLSQRGWPRWMVYLASVVSGIYLLNPTAGLLELLPDNLPLVGNLDEGAAFLLVWYGILEYLKRRRPSP